MYKFKFIVLILSVILIFNTINVNYSLASEELNQKSLISSGEKVLFAWQKMLSKGCLDVSQDKGKERLWKVNKYLWFPESGSYDIKKSDSIVSPYILIIRFKIKHCGDNFFSPNANGSCYKLFKRKCGFNSAQEALANCKTTDFVDSDGMPEKESVFDMMLTYLYQDGFWVIGKGNEYFEIFLGQDLKSELNKEYFKDLLRIPAK